MKSLMGETRSFGMDRASLVRTVRSGYLVGSVFRGLHSETQPYWPSKRHTRYTTDLHNPEVVYLSSVAVIQASG